MATDKKVEFHQDEHFEALEFHIMGRVITNEIMLFCL